MNTPLHNIVIDKIRQDGPLSFADYMEMALYYPKLGYYRSSKHPFGPEGDFVTSPELSPLFAGCLANACVVQLPNYGQQILEIGPGSGVLACELLAALEKVKALPERYYLLELSGSLVSKQQELIKTRLPHLYDRCEWLTSWPPQPIPAVVIANELFDAMPVHKFKIESGETKEFYVTENDGELQWLLREASSELMFQIESYNLNLPDNYESEVNLLIKPWVKSFASALTYSYALFIDYGYKREVYYHPERSMGTLMCHHKHRAHDDPLVIPGEQDITAHVDFTLLAEAAIECGFEVLGLQTQSEFMLKHGVTDLLSQVEDQQQQLLAAQQLKQLILPGRMGEAFKVLSLMKSPHCPTITAA